MNIKQKHVQYFSILDGRFHLSVMGNFLTPQPIKGTFPLLTLTVTLQKTAFVLPSVRWEGNFLAELKPAAFEPVLIHPAKVKLLANNLCKTLYPVLKDNAIIKSLIRHGTLC